MYYNYSSYKTCEQKYVINVNSVCLLQVSYKIMQYNVLQQR